MRLVLCVAPRIKLELTWKLKWGSIQPNTIGVWLHRPDTEWTGECSITGGQVPAHFTIAWEAFCTEGSQSSALGLLNQNFRIYIFKSFPGDSLTTGRLPTNGIRWSLAGIVTERDVSTEECSKWQLGNDCGLLGSQEMWLHIELRCLPNT